MLQSFIWMFKTEGFKKHFLCLFFGSLLLYLIAFALIFTNIFVLVPAAYLLSIVPSLYIMGYFWNLTEQIISRDNDISANNVYDGKITEVNRVTLPSLAFFKNIWRGIASIFAILLLLVPFIFLFAVGSKYGTLSIAIPMGSMLMTLFCVLLMPAMLWYYSYKNSVVSVWNIRKVIYIIGNYPLRYFSRVICLLILVVINSVIDSHLVKFLPANAQSMASLDFVGGIIAISVCLIFGLKYLYFVYVNAYLLGTIAPTSEA